MARRGGAAEGRQEACPGGREPLPKPEQLKAKREREKWSPLDVPGACWKMIPFINLGWVASLVFFSEALCVARRGMAQAARGLNSSRDSQSRAAPSSRQQLGFCTWIWSGGV